jgi:hypothetical protein
MRCVPVRHDKVSTGCMALGLAIGFGTGRVSTSLFFCHGGPKPMRCFLSYIRLCLIQKRHLMFSKCGLEWPYVVQRETSNFGLTTCAKWI